MARTRFFGYPSQPELIGQSIEAANKIFAARLSKFEIKTWPQVFKFGEFIDSNVLGAIDQCEIAYFDVSVPNFNVFFEAGYSIGSAKPTIFVINTSLEGAGRYLDEIGLFDVVGQARYENSAQLLEVVADDAIPRPVLPTSYEANFAQPLYVLKPRTTFEGMARVLGALTETSTQFRTFDPTEDLRMSLRDAVQHVAESTGVICAVVSREIADAENHNLRAAFLAGLARGMARELLLLNMSSKPLPLDVRDYAKNGVCLDGIQRHVHAFALKSLARLQRALPAPDISSLNTIQRISLGSPSAENEFRRLAEYFVETPASGAAADGQGRIVIGRKGSGKTAIFTEIGRQLSQGKDSLVLSLKPESYQLRKFKDNLIRFLEEGTKEHTVAAFWDYLILLELCHQCISHDDKLLGRNPDVSRMLPQLIDKYGGDKYVIEGDFSERTLLLLNDITRRYSQAGSAKNKAYLSRADLTEIIYSHDIKQLRKDMCEYLSVKRRVVILIDNLDKGWDSKGVSSSDLLMLRTLIDACRKLERDLDKVGVESFCLVFLRNDIYELLLDETPDRGKEGKIAIDWTDRELLKQVIQRRLKVSAGEQMHWGRIAVSQMEGQGSLDWVIDRSLMRPRYLIDIVNRCLGAAASKGHERIEPGDFLSGYSAFSLDALVNTNLEIRDVAPKYFDALFALRGLKHRTSQITLSLALLGRSFEEENHKRIIELLIWYGVLGVVDESGSSTYIYDVEYNSHVLEQIRFHRDEDGEMFEINKAFWPALKIEQISDDQLALAV